jgi:hypothetical protein
MDVGDKRWTGWALAAVAAGAWVIRALPFLRFGALGSPVDYDEGVYFSAAALLLRFVLPYRDFVFVHPPGSLLLGGIAAALSSWMDVDTGFAGARWMAAGVGALNVWLVGRLALRTWGPVAGLMAALAYATYPEAVVVERGPYLEPLLNLACLALANVWLVRPGPEARGRPWLWAGVLGGVALSVKVLGGLWLAAALLSRPSRSTWREPLGFVLAAGATVLLLVGPFLAASPSGFIGDVLLFQFQRPGDGSLGWFERLQEIFHARRGGSVGLALMGLGLATWRARRPDSATRPAERFFAFTYAVTVAAFLSSPSYWNQYNAHLAPSESVLVGLAAGAIHHSLRARRRTWAGAVLALGVLAVTLGARETLEQLPGQWAPGQWALGRYIRERVPAEAPLCAFEPAWALLGGRLPATFQGSPQVVVDTYALMLRDAMASGAHFESTGEALGTPAAQRDIRRWLEQCRFVVLGGRGSWQLTEESHRWFESRFVRRFPEEGQPGVDVWERIHARLTPRPDRAAGADAGSRR